MRPTAKSSRGHALHGLRSPVAGQPMADRVLAHSQERPLRYREPLEHAAVREPGGALPPDPKGRPPSYRAFVLTPDGRIACTQVLACESDAEALHAAAAVAETHGVDLWDGLRFIEHFEPRSEPKFEPVLRVG